MEKVTVDKPAKKEKTPKKHRFRILKTVLLFMLVLPLCALMFMAAYLYGLDEWKTFDPADVADMAEVSIMYDGEGQQILELPSTESRISVPLSEVPQHVIDALLVVEDLRFYQHQGVDLIRIGGALVNDILSGSLSEGASTISQQLIKNTMLTSDKTLSRKLQEIIMAYKLEKYYNKDQILEMYLNQNYYGRGAYGIESAARKYFGKHVSELTLGEGATLVGVLKAPNRYAPHLHPDKAMNRRNLVLRLMSENGFITEAEAARESALPIKIVDNEEKEKYGFYTDMAIDEACLILNINRQTLYSGGYRIYTALNADLQDIADRAFANSSLFPDDMADGSGCEAAFVAINNGDGSICAVNGAREYKTKFGLNRATSIYRQPGSAIKPVMVYALALEKLNFSPTTFILDEPVDFSGYSPRNFNNKTSGWVTMRDCISRSLNIPAVKVLNMVGVDNAKKYASSVGIPFDEDDHSLTLALGGFTTGVSPLTLAASYTPFANGGTYIQPYCVKKITDKNGNTVYEHSDAGVNVLSPKNAYLMTNMLMSTVETGTAKKVQIDGVPVAAKTGTASTGIVNGNSDSWIVAYTPEYTTCTWMGYDRTDETHCLPNDITGGTKPAELTHYVLQSAYRNKKCPGFNMPEGVLMARIDKQALLEDKEALLAGAFTPDEYAIYEYYTAENIPSAVSRAFDIPRALNSVILSLDADGYPVIAYTPLEVDVSYALVREDTYTKKTTVIHETGGKEGKVEFNDRECDLTNNYNYYVIPRRVDYTGNEITGAKSNVAEYKGRQANVAP